MCGYQAKHYIQALDPIVWLSSEKWFTFVKRRLDCLAQFQNELSRFRPRPLNYGSLTNVLAYLIQCVGITPIVKDSDLREDLYSLRFQQISRRFGCFFLQNLNLTTAELPEINKKDPPDLLCRMGIKPVAQKSRKKGQALKPPTLPTTDGVTWAGLKTHITKGDKKAEILPFQFDPLYAAYSVAEALFCAFTTQFWALVSETKFTRLPPLVTLEDAMERWTVESVRTRIKNEVHYDLMPSADGLDGAVPPMTKTQLFRNKRVSFFPEPGSIPDPRSRWCAFFTIGYVKDYHNALNNSVDKGKALRDALDNIFQRLQVLPRKPPLPSSHKTLWCWEGGQMNLLLNSTYIRLVNRNILPTARLAKGTNTGSRNTRSKAQVTEILLGQKEHTQPKQTKALRKAIMRKPSMRYPVTAPEEPIAKGRRGKAKSYRNPPKRRLLSSSPKLTVVELESEESDAKDADDEKEDCATGGKDGGGKEGREKEEGGEREEREDTTKTKS